MSPLRLESGLGRSAGLLLAMALLVGASNAGDQVCLDRPVRADIGAPTYAEDLAVIGHHLLFAGEGGLEVWDLNDPADPSRISGLWYLDGLYMDVYHVEADENREIVFCSTRATVVIADVSDPARPVALSELSGVSMFSVVGEVLVAATMAGQPALVFYDVSEPSQPVEVSRFQSLGHLLGMTGLLARDEIVYVLQEGRDLHVLDSSNLAEPRVIASVTLDFDGMCPPGLCETNEPITADNGLMVVGDPDAGEMYLVDIADPLQPVDVGALGPFFDVVLSGARAFASSHEGELHIIDVSTPTAPMTLVEFELGAAWFRSRVAMVGTCVVVAGYDRSLTAVDVSEAVAPRVLGQVPGLGYLYGIEEQDGLAVASMGALGVRTLDVGDPLEPRVLGHVVVDGRAHEVVLAAGNRHAAVAAWNGGLAVVGLDDPANPQLLAMHGTEAYARRIAGSGDRIVVAEEPGDLEFQGFELFDLSDPSAPEFLARVPTAREIDDIAMDGSVVFVADGDLHLYDCANPGDVVDLASLSYGRHNTVAVSSGLALVSSYGGGSESIGLFDVSEPTTPLELWTTNGPWGRVADFDGTLGVMAGYGVYVVDATDPIRPELFGWGPYAGVNAGDVALVDAMVLLANHPYLDVMTLECRPPEADIRLAQSGYVVELRDTSLYGPESRLWVLGDGTTSDRYQLIHRYEEPGIYEVTLTVSNSLGTSSATRLVVVPHTRPPSPRRPQGRVGP